MTLTRTNIACDAPDFKIILTSDFDGELTRRRRNFSNMRERHVMPKLSKRRKLSIRPEETFSATCICQSTFRLRDDDDRRRYLMSTHRHRNLRAYCHSITGDSRRSRTS